MVLRQEAVRRLLLLTMRARAAKELQADAKLSNLPAPLARAFSGRDTHDPPLSEATLSFLATSGPSTARAEKLFWLSNQYEKGDPRLIEAIANIDEIEFTIRQRCDRPLRRFFVCGGKVFCTDCWLDHRAEPRTESAARA